MMSQAGKALQGQKDGGFREIACWIFDLDNTLYPASCKLFEQVGCRMDLFIAQKLDMELEAAQVLRRYYYRNYGTTLSGLMQEHGISPNEFLDFVHQVDHSLLPADTGLDQALTSLPGRKLVFTNGSRQHAEKVLLRLNVRPHFEEIFDIMDANYIPKPDLATYHRLIQRHGFLPEHAAMVEDLERNLRPAAALGMMTVLVEGEEADRPSDNDILDYIHYRTDNLPGWLREYGAAISGTSL